MAGLTRLAIRQAMALHDAAMKRVDDANMALLCDSRSTETHKSYMLTALNQESEAASILETINLEPSRSILFKSAAWIAVECGEIHRAEELVRRGLDGNPPDIFRQEFRDIRKEIERVRET